MLEKLSDKTYVIEMPYRGEMVPRVQNIRNLWKVGHVVGEKVGEVGLEGLLDRPAGSYESDDDDDDDDKDVAKHVLGSAEESVETSDVEAGSKVVGGPTAKKDSEVGEGAVDTKVDGQTATSDYVMTRSGRKSKKPDFY